MLVAALLTNVLSRLGSLPGPLVDTVVFALVFGEAALFVGFVLPGETAVLVAGALASQGHVNLVGLCCLVVVAAIVGDSVGYAVGQRYGQRLLTLPVIRHRRAAIERALGGLERRGSTYVFVGRFTAFLRAVMPGLAGMSKMHYRHFLLANALGGLIWGVGYTLLGYFAGAALGRVEHTASWAAVGVLVVVVALVYWHHRRRARADAELERTWDRQHPGDGPAD
jgi:membrane protein DedA with SNARE-associated domain